MTLRYTPEAWRDLLELGSYIRDVLSNPTSASRLQKRILDGCALLKRHPQLGMSLQEKLSIETDLRVLVVERHLAFYRVEDDVISIARIINGRRDYLHILFGEL